MHKKDDLPAFQLEPQHSISFVVDYSTTESPASHEKEAKLMIYELQPVEDSVFGINGTDDDAADIHVLQRLFTQQHSFLHESNPQPRVQQILQIHQYLEAKGWLIDSDDRANFSLLCRDFVDFNMGKGDLGHIHTRYFNHLVLTGFGRNKIIQRLFFNYTDSLREHTPKMMLADSKEMAKPEFVKQLIQIFGVGQEIVIKKYNESFGTGNTFLTITEDKTDLASSITKIAQSGAFMGSNSDKSNDLGRLVLIEAVSHFGHRASQVHTHRGAMAYRPGFFNFINLKLYISPKNNSNSHDWQEQHYFAIPTPRSQTKAKDQHLWRELTAEEVKKNIHVKQHNPGLYAMMQKICLALTHINFQKMLEFYQGEDQQFGNLFFNDDASKQTVQILISSFARWKEQLSPESYQDCLFDLPPCPKKPRNWEHILIAIQLLMAKDILNSEIFAELVKDTPVANQIARSIRRLHQQNIPFNIKDVMQLIKCEGDWEKFIGPTQPKRRCNPCAFLMGYGHGKVKSLPSASKVDSVQVVQTTSPQIVVDVVTQPAKPAATSESDSSGLDPKRTMCTIL